VRHRFAGLLAGGTVLRWVLVAMARNPCMKLLLAIIQPTKLKAVQESLARLGVERMSVYDAQGYARQRGQTAMYRGMEYKSRLLRKITLEIAVNDDFLERTIDTINQVARTGPDGEIGDGKIFVLPMDDVWQLGGQERGQEAI
jgi:nitrogen regulatory protein P-II 2